MMNCSPMWGQSNVPFMGNMMAPNMMRYGDNTSSHSNFRRNFDQRDRRFQPRRRQEHPPEGNRRGGKRSRFSPRNGKRPAARRSRSPPAKRVAKEADTAEEEEEKVVKTEEEAGGENLEEEPSRGTEEEEDLYDPADPTNDAAEEAPESKGEGYAEDALDAEAEIDKFEDANLHSTLNEGAAPTEEAQDDFVLQESNEEGLASEAVEEVPKDSVEGEEAAVQYEDTPSAGDPCGTPEKQQTPVKSAQQTPVKGAQQAEKDDKPVKKSAAEEKPAQNVSKSPKKPAEAARKPEEKKSDHRRDVSSSRKQKGKGWCTVCELNFDGSFLEHRRTEEHKRKRDQKYPKCHPCSMGFANSKQYELHCSGNFHKKNVEVQDNEIDEKSNPLGAEYLEEITAFFCTLCHVLLKPDVKDQHCRTRGHYRRHRDVKRKEETSKSKEIAEDDDAIFTITDEIVSDDEGKGESVDKPQPASEVTADEAAKVDEQTVPDAGVESASPVVDTTMNSDVPTETAEPEVTTEVCPADNNNANGDTGLETSVVQGVDEEMSGYKTADDATPEKVAAVNSAKAVSVTSTPKSTEGSNRGRARGPIGRGRAIRGRRR
uniref:Putative transcriptional regulator icp22 n=1 Tax=Ornithodoros turicata TaxID=34597 RepID=A0A2R5LB89_9ACAR